MLSVNLKELNAEGESFSFKRGQEPELDAAVDSVFQGVAYTADFVIMPLGGAFMAKGELTNGYTGQCSLCGDEMSTDVTRKFSEYLVKEETRQAEGHAPHSGLNLNSEQDVTFFSSYEFDLAEFLREQFAISTPAYPKCEKTKQCEKKQAENKMHLSRVSIDGHPAFQVLDQLKKH